MATSKLVSWNTTYSVGNDLLDGQHQQILEMINDLFSAMKQGHDREALGPLLDRLLDYTDAHFVAEEQIMRQCAFPNIEYHMGLHDRLRRKTAELHNQTDVLIATELLQFLKNWWLEHIQEEDQQYTPYTRAAANQR